MNQRRKREQRNDARAAGPAEQRAAGVPQPDIADSFRRAKAALDAAARDIAAVRRRASAVARRTR